MTVYRIFDVFNGSEADEGSRKMNLKPFENFILYVSLILREKKKVRLCTHTGISLN